MGRWTRRTVLGLAAGVGAILVGLALWHTAREPVPHTWLGTAVSDPGAPLEVTLVDMHGARRPLSDWRGRLLLVTFGYTGCQEGCADTLTAVAEAVRSLPEPLAARVQVLFVSVDPERDVPERLAAWVPRFHPDLLGVTGDPGALATLRRAWGLTWKKRPGPAPDAYTLSHPTQVFLVGPEGRLWARYESEDLARPEALAADLLHVLDEVP